jgi:hypothetical protein
VVAGAGIDGGVKKRWMLWAYPKYQIDDVNLMLAAEYNEHSEKFRFRSCARLAIRFYEQNLGMRIKFEIVDLREEDGE